MMAKGGYARFVSTSSKMSVPAQCDVYLAHIEKLLGKELNFKSKTLYLHGLGYTSKFLPTLTKLLIKKGYKVKGVSTSSPHFSAFQSMKGSYEFGAANHLIARSSVLEQADLINF